MTREPHPPASARPQSPSLPDTGLSSVPPLLSTRATVVFLAAGFIGVVMGGLMFLSEKSAPTAIAAGIAAAGASIPVLRNLIG